MWFIGKDSTKKRAQIVLLCLSIVLLVYLGTKTNFSRTKEYKRITISESYPFLPSDDTTSTFLIEETTTSVEKITTTTIKVVVTIPRTTISTVQDSFSEHDGPPRNITSLIGCIAYYESTWGLDPNVFQFIQSTWEAYGGVGYPGNAPYSRQEEIFWLAWHDDGPNHWAAQQGRCF